MLKGCKILTSFCVICATLYGGAYGAASVRGGATSRAGSIRTLGAGTTASVKTTTSRAQPTTTAANANTETTESVDGMRMSHATGLSGTKLPGKVSGTSTSSTASNQNVAELRQAIEQLRNDYDALGEQYNNLLGDVSNVSDTAQVAHETATNNTNTLTVVRSDLSVAKSDIEDLKATGGFDEERVQEALDTTLAQRNYATRGELAATDAVARGAVQVADLPQTLNALNIADKDYVASRTQGVVNDSLNITLENYYTKGQVNAAIDVAKTGMVDKQYVDHMVDGLAAKTYVDNRVDSVQTGVSEGAVQGIINNSIDTRLGNYYTKDDIDNAIGDAIDAAKDGMAALDYVNNQVRDTMQYVDKKVAEKETGVDAGTLYNILETRGYKTGTEVRGIVNDSINNTVANYYTKGQVDNAIATAKKDMVDKQYVNNMVDGLVDESRVNTIVNNRIATLPLGLDQNAVKAVVEGYGYKDEAGVQEMINASGHVKTSELPDLIKQWAPGAEIQYADGKLYFVDKDGNDRVVDIRGIDGQDGVQVELRQNDGWIQWHYEGDTEWNNLVAMSDLKGADGESVKLDVQSMNGYKNALVYSKENESNWQFLYSLDDIKGADGCGIKVETNDYVSGGALLGKTVKLLRDCPASSLDGAQLTSFNVLNGADGTVTEEQIVDALESDETFKQLKTKVANLETNQSETYNLAMGVSDAVENPETGLAATNTLANKAWNKVKDLDPNVTTKDYVDSYVNGKIGNLDYDPTTYGKFASVAAKLGSIGNKTMKDYVDEKVRGVTTEINVDKGDDGFTYICKNGNACTSKPNSWDNQWERIDVDLSGYLNKETADSLYASFGTEVMARDAATAAAAAQTTANKAWGKLDDLGNKTVKSYVEDVVGVGSLGINPLTGVSYTVAGKLGFGQGTATQTVKEYIDEKFRSVNTEIMIADGPDGLMYICRKGNTCTTPAGPSNSYEWAAVSVDMSDYLKESDAEKKFATITALNEAKTTANEAKTAATAAQTSATQAQNAANSAQSKADDAWGKLESLGYKTVTEYVDEKVESTGLSIRVEPGDDGYTYICTAKDSDCRDTPSSTSNYWSRINFNIPSEYLTENEGDVRYAPKAEYALKSYVDGNIGTLGGSFTNVGAKIGLNDSNNSSKTVRQYVDDRIGDTGTFYDLTRPKTVVEFVNGRIGTLGTYENVIAYGNANYALKSVQEAVNDTTTGLGRTYDLANTANTTANNAWDKVKGLNDVNGLSNKTVTGYVDYRLGNIPGSQTVAEYISENTPKFQMEKVGTQWYICKNGNCTGTPPSGSGWEEFDMNVDLSDYYTKGDSDGKFALKTTIGNMGGHTVDYDWVPYTVEEKIGLNDVSTKSATVKSYVDNVVGAVDSKLNGYVTTTKMGNIPNEKTIKEYIDDKTLTITVKVSATDGNSYICTGTDCSASDPYNNNNWTKLNVDLTEINNAIDDLKNSKADKTMLDDYATEQYVDDAIGNKIGSLGSREVDGERKPYTVSEKLGLPADYGDATVAKYIVDYVAERAASGGVTVKTIINNGVNETYICSENCENNPPCRANDTCGWQKLEVDLSQYLKSSDAADTYLPQTGLKLHRNGRSIELQQVSGGTVVKNYGPIADVEDLMCRSYRTETVGPGVDGCPASGSACYKMICNTNGND